MTNEAFQKTIANITAPERAERLEQENERLREVLNKIESANTRLMDAVQLAYSIRRNTIPLEKLEELSETINHALIEADAPPPSESVQPTA